MNSEFPLFDRKNLKRFLYYFLVGNLFIAGVSYIAAGLLSQSFSHLSLGRTASWVFILLIGFASMIHSTRSKKELQAIIESTDYDKKFEMYERRFKNRLIWSAVSLWATGVLFAISRSRIFFYLLIIQLILSLFFFPSKKIIRIELKNDDIVFND